MKILNDEELKTMYEKGRESSTEELLKIKEEIEELLKIKEEIKLENNPYIELSTSKSDEEKLKTMTDEMLNVIDSLLNERK